MRNVTDHEIVEISIINSLESNNDDCGINRWDWQRQINCR